MGTEDGRTPFLRGLFCVFLSIAAFVITNVCVDAMYWKSLPGTLRPGFEYFEAHKDEIDVVFIGSSFAKRHIDPRVFDQELARAGYRVRSVNLAALGMSVFGSDLMAQRILQLQPKRLRWIVVDIGFFGVKFMPKSRCTGEVLWWHTAKLTAAVIRAAFARELPRDANRKAVGDHFAHFLRRFTHLGMGPFYVNETRNMLAREPLGSAKLSKALREFESHRGFMPNRRTQLPAFVKTRDAFEKKVDRFREAGHWPPKFVDRDLHLPFLVDQAERMRAEGVEPVYVVPPLVRAYPETLDPANPVHFLRYNDPVEYPQFYAFEARRDFGHLFRGPAREYTRLLARDFAEIYSGTAGAGLR